MATKFLEPGGDATFNSGAFWLSAGSTSVVTDFVHGSHVKSIKYALNTTSQNRTPVGTASDSGTRSSMYFYVNAYPTATRDFLDFRDDTGNKTVLILRMTSTGVLQLLIGGTSTQIGPNGATIPLGEWHRISVAYTISSSTVNEFRVFVDGVISITGSNVTMLNTGATNCRIGYPSSDLTFDLRSSDHYMDDSSSLLDTGDIWVTAKRPTSNGTTNGFTTQVGSGGSGYGSGHSPQVNERPLSNTNGWSIAAVSATTEEYNIESKSTGDIDITTATIVDYVGWVDCKAVLAETGQIIVNGANSNISIPANTETLFTQSAGSAVYPVGTGTDIGLITSATVTTVSLYECGVIVAYIPGTPASAPVDSRPLEQNTQIGRKYNVIGY